MPGHERAWADALAQEHLHQQELLATLRDELGTFARECASALTALATFAGLAGVNEILSTAETAVAHARLALEVGRRLQGQDDAQLVDLYEQLAGHEDVPPPLVRHASDLLAAGPKRSDRQLLEAVVTASGAPARIEQLVGPAPWAALAAMKPLVTWVRSESREELLESAAGDLAQVLSAAAARGAGVEAEAAADASALGQSLRDAVDHVERAAASVHEGKLAAVLKEARERLEDDLDELRGIHENADGAPPDWLHARKAEHVELAEEVRVKLERVERIRGVLLRLLPHLQAVVRTLGVVEKLHTLEGRLEPEAAAGFEASRATLVLVAGELWAACRPPAPPEPRTRRISRRVQLLAAAAAIAIGAAVGVTLGGGSSKPKAIVTETTPAAAPATTGAAAPTTARPNLLPVSAVFDPNRRATFYTVSVEQGGEPIDSYRWSLTPPPGNPTCNKLAPVPGHANEAVWHHADTDGCTHNGIQHDGTVHVTAVSAHWRCTESFFGTLTRTGAKNESCARR